VPKDLRSGTRALSVLPSARAGRAGASGAEQARRTAAPGVARRRLAACRANRIPTHPEAGRPMSGVFARHHHRGHLVQVVSLASESLNASVQA
jgi:hypothetical protein